MKVARVQLPGEGVWKALEKTAANKLNTGLLAERTNSSSSSNSSDYNLPANIPAEIGVLIFSFLSDANSLPELLLSFALVNRQWHQATRYAITELDLHWNYSYKKITDDTIRRVSPYCLSLRKLNLKMCRCVSNRGLRILADTNRHFLEKLESLDLTLCCYITDFGLRQLLKWTPNLKVLTLDGCIEITDTSYMSHLKKLRLLSLRGCRRMTDESLLSGVMHMESLQTLILSGCNFTDSVVNVLNAPDCPLRNLALLDLCHCNRMNHYHQQLSPAAGSSSAPRTSSSSSSLQDYDTNLGSLLGMWRQTSASYDGAPPTPLMSPSTSMSTRIVPRSCYGYGR